jgi:hypothetical protein
MRSLRNSPPRYRFAICGVAFAWLALEGGCSRPAELPASAPAAAGQEFHAIYGETQTLDLGMVVLDHVQNDFGISLSNPSDQTLRVSNVRTSCGCLGAEVVPAEIPPGGRGNLLVRPGRSAGSERSIRVTVTSDTHPTWEIVLVGMFIKRYRWEPADLLVPAVLPNEEKTSQAILFLPREGPEAPKLDIRADPADGMEVVACTFRGSEHHRYGILDQFEVTVSIRGNGEAGNHSAVLQAADGSRGVVAELPVRWSVLQPLAAYPQALGFVGKGPQTRVLFLQSNDASTFQITEAVCESKWVQVEVSKHKPALRQQIRVSLRSDALPPGNNGQPLRASLRIRLNHPLCRDVEVPVSCMP